MNFCKDADILCYEPVLFGDLHFPWQVSASGSGAALNGTALSKTGADFTAEGICAGQVVYLTDSGGASGGFEIVSVDSPDQLTISILRTDSEQEAIAPNMTGDNMQYRISTFEAQGSEISFALMQYFGISTSDAASIGQIAKAAVLRQATVFGVLSSVFATLADTSAASDILWKKSLHYHKLFERARELAHIEIDRGSDGFIDTAIAGGSCRLKRV